MARTVLCTAGTSIARGCTALDGYQRRLSDWDEPAVELRTQIQRRLANLDLNAPKDRADASAELNALHRLKIAPDDEVVLFVTDTADGHCCAEAVRDVLTGRSFGLDLQNVVIERIPGLQVRDAHLLRTDGLVNLTRRLIGYLDDPQRRFSGGCLLCPNGGFKGVVPFVTLLGMIYRAPVVYVFEFAEELIRLPPLPLGFSTDLFERALPALRWARSEGVFDPEAFYRRISRCETEERILFDSFLELAQDGDREALASLSPLAEVLTQREGGPEASLMLSTRARADIDRLSGPALTIVQGHLRKLGSPLWRSQHRATKYNSDLDFYPTGHNPWRFAGFETDGIFHLCWFAQHDEYDRQIPLVDRQRAAFPGAEFVRYVIPAVPYAAPEVDLDADLNWLDLRSQRDAAMAGTVCVEAEMADLAAKFESERERFKQQLAEARQELWATRARLAEAEHALESQVNDHAADDPPVDLAQWKGRTVLALLVESRAKSWVFETDAGNDARLQIVVSLRELPAPPGSQPIRLLVTGHDGRHLQARPVA